MVSLLRFQSIETVSINRLVL